MKKSKTNNSEESYKIDNWTIVKKPNETYLYTGITPDDDHELIDVCRMSDYEDLMDKLKEAQKLNADLIRIAEFYADPNNYSRGDGMLYDKITSSDCADYPHITRDIKKTGGKMARDFMAFIKKKIKNN